MKNILITLLLLTTLLFQSCRNNDDDTALKNEPVTFGITLPPEASGGRAANIELSSIRVTIENSAGEIVLDDATITIVETTEGFVSDPVSLPPGDYELTGFFVLDADDVARFATPLEGSPRADLVSDPLPISFVVVQDETTNVPVEVLSLDGVDPSELGYVTFPFTIIETFFFELAVFERDTTTGNTSLTEAQLTILSAGDTLRTLDLIAGVNAVEVQENLDTYTLMVSKEGFANFEASYTQRELEAFSPGNTPLQVILEFASGSPSISFVDSGQAYTVTGGHGVAIGDLDGDGDLDAMVVYQTSGNSNTIWFNQGNGFFSEGNQRLVSSTSTDVALGDLDGDGDLDAFITNLTNSGHTVWINDGNGSFQDSGQRLGGRGTSVSLGDLDGDSDLDALVTGQFGGNSVWFNDSNGDFNTSFSVIVNNASNLTVSDGILTDVDADNDLDVVIVGISIGGELYLNNGDGSFNNLSPYNLSDEPMLTVDANDFDNDNDQDILLLGGGPLTNEFLGNNGNGTYSSQAFVTSSQFRNVSSADLDGDGDIDFVAVSPSSPEPSIVFSNQGDGTFVEAQLLLEGSASNDVAIGDLNGDGIPDLFIPQDQNLKVFFGQP